MIVEPVDDLVVDPIALDSRLTEAPPLLPVENVTLPCDEPIAQFRVSDVERAFQQAAQVLDDPEQFQIVARALLAYTRQ